MKSSHIKSGLYVLCVVLIMVLTCEESLPLRGDPNDLFTTCAMAYQDIQIQLRRNNFTFIFVIKNMYKETIHDNVLMTGDIEIEKTSTIYFKDFVTDVCLAVPYLYEANPPNDPCLQLKGIDPCILIGGK